MCRTLYFALPWPFFPFFHERTKLYNKKRTDLIRSGSTEKYPTSLSLGQYSKSSRLIFSRPALNLGQ
jgi:hypothetical protein